MAYEAVMVPEEHLKRLTPAHPCISDMQGWWYWRGELEDPGIRGP